MTECYYYYYKLQCYKHLDLQQAAHSETLLRGLALVVHASGAKIPVRRLPVPERNWVLTEGHMVAAIAIAFAVRTRCRNAHSILVSRARVVTHALRIVDHTICEIVRVIALESGEFEQLIVSLDIACMPRHGESGAWCTCTWCVPCCVCT